MMQHIFLSQIFFWSLSVGFCQDLQIPGEAPQSKETSATAPFQISKEAASRYRFEVGAATGFPVVLGIQFGFWGSEDFPLVARVALGGGSTLDLGVSLPIKEGTNVQVFIALTGGIFGYLDVLDSVLYSIGPTVGIRYGVFFFQAGPAMYYGKVKQFAGQGSLGLSADF